MAISEMYQTVTAHLYDFMIPVCALYVLRIGICFAELGHMRRLREKKNAYHGVAKHYAEVGCMACMLVFGVLTCLLPGLWIVPFAVMLLSGVLGWRLGKRRGEAADEHWRAMALSQSGETPAPAVDTGYNGLLDTLDVYDDEHNMQREQASAASGAAAGTDKGEE